MSVAPAGYGGASPTTYREGDQSPVVADAALAAAQERQARLESLDAAIAVMDAERADAKRASSRNRELTEDWPVFIRRMRMLTPQAYGSRIQKYLEHFYGWGKVNASEARGDSLDDGRHVEVKVTLITASNRTANFVQIRPHHDLHGYRMLVVDESYVAHRFDLTKEQMAAELERIGQYAHGTKAHTNSEGDVEWAIRLSWKDGDADRLRWERTYAVDAVTPDQMGDEYRTAAELEAQADGQ